MMYGQHPPDDQSPQNYLKGEAPRPIHRQMNQNKELRKLPSFQELQQKDHSTKDAFTQEDLNVLIENHDKFINPRGNENAKKVGSSRSDFQIIEKLGKGAHGTVYKVRSLKNTSVYVMKEINFTSQALQLGYKREALREVQLLKMLQNHPHVVRYYNSFMEEGCLHIIMEYCEKGDLYRHLKSVSERGSNITEDFIWILTFQICLAVGYLHSQRIIHRDLKCMNIFLTKDDVVKIGDFGVAKVFNGNQNQADQANQGQKVARVGTPLYLSPEVMRQNPYDFKVDAWAIGCCVYHLAELNPPFQSDDLKELSMKILSDTPKPLNSKIYSEKLNHLVIGSLLQKDPNQRPYILQLMKHAHQHFSNEILRRYKYAIFSYYL